MGSYVTPFGLRMPEDLRKRITRSAKAAHRSIHSEVVLRLQESVKQEMSHGAGGDARLGPEERLLLENFGSLPPNRQKALLELLTGHAPDDDE
jgi:hypothetical protein